MIKARQGNRKPLIGRILQIARRKSVSARKLCYQAIRSRAAGVPCVALVVGCQRSGTTLLCEIFEEDFRSVVLREVSIITCPELRRQSRLRPYPEVNQIVAALRVPLVVAKPLVESQHTRQMLDGISGAKAIWLFRDYHDVVQSNTNMFCNQVRDVMKTLGMLGPNWRSENVSEETHAILTRFYRPDMSIHDAAALFWWSRNKLFFELELDARDDVLPLKYEDLVSNPEHVMRRVYTHLEVEYPRRQITAGVHSASVGKGQQVRLDEEIQTLCDELQQRLNDCYRSRWQAAPFLV